jgi:hypothetical protein
MSVKPAVPFGAGFGEEFSKIGGVLKALICFLIS